MEAGAITGGRAPKLLLAAAAATLCLFLSSLLGLALLLGGSPGCSGAAGVGALNSKVPGKLVPIYYGAAERYALGARGAAVLAGINFVETGFGTNVATSSAGANGWMAFMPETWAEWGVDADGDGKTDPYDPEDAIYSAANYLHDSGAPDDWREAVFAYNHADWYVEKVLRYARQFSSGAEVQLAGACAGAPNDEVERMVAEAERLSALRPSTEYVWGGSHGLTPTPANGPFDCSSAVSHLLQIAGLRAATMDTVVLSRWGKPGPGQWVTIFNKPYGEDAHTFIRFSPGVTPASERYWGTSGQWFAGHGPGWIPESIFGAGYLAGFELRHPPGL